MSDLYCFLDYCAEIGVKVGPGCSLGQFGKGSNYILDVTISQTIIDFYLFLRVIILSFLSDLHAASACC